ncbi:MAG: GGDEF domain-containing protein [Lachnospiraceae bacterium]|nr:GGDEF domain-containing protein [Lachnospiraceae bacterium]
MSGNTIAVCIVKMEENFQSDAIKSITRRAEERGLYVEIYNSFEELVNNDLHDKGEESIFEVIDYRHLYGIIFFPEKIKSSRINEKIVNYANEHGLPVVAVDRKVDGCISLTFDYRKAFEDIVEHLILVHKCRTFFMMAGMRNNSFSDERIAAARRIIEKHGYELPEENVGYGDFWDMPTKRVITEYLESGRPLPDAFIAANDTMAMVICDELIKRGYKVPGDTIVTGFDGIEAERYASPRLTTAETDLERAGAIAIDSILSYYSSNKPISHIIVPFHTRYSQSCGCSVPMPGSTNGALQKLHNDVNLIKLYVNMMASMLTKMSTTDNLLDMVKLTDRYRKFFEDFKDCFICVRKSIVVLDDSIKDKLVFPEGISKGADGDNDRQMVLLYENHVDRGTEYPLTVFRARDVLPNRSNIIESCRNLIFAPLHVQDKVYGYVAFSAEPHRVEYNYYQLSFFTRNLSQAISEVVYTIRINKSTEKLKAANQKLEALSATDYLTGVNNRRGFFNTVDYMARIPKYDSFIVASIDLNGLKKINDKYGHNEGDRAICLISSILEKMLDENCVCARFGGDEFAFCRFCEGDAELKKKEFLEEFRSRVSEVNNKEKFEYLFSASCGAIIAPVGEVYNLDRLLIAADEKMYAEKEEFHRTHKEYDRRKADRK